MRKTAFFIGLAAAVGTAVAQTGLPTTDQILEKYVQAIGGKAAVEKLTSRYMKGTVEVVTYNSTGSFESWDKAPSKHLMKSEFDGYGQVLQVCDGVAAWTDTPDNGRQDLSGPALASQKRTADFYGALHMKDHYSKMTVAGKGKVGARDVYVIEATPAEGSPEKLSFDAENGLLLRLEAQPPEGTVTVLYEDYKDVDGVKISHVSKIEMPNLSLVYKATEVKHGVPVEDAKFVKPAAK